MVFRLNPQNEKQVSLFLLHFIDYQKFMALASEAEAEAEAVRAVVSEYS